MKIKNLSGQIQKVFNSIPAEDVLPFAEFLNQEFTPRGTVFGYAEVVEGSCISFDWVLYAIKSSGKITGYAVVEDDIGNNYWILFKQPPDAVIARFQAYLRECYEAAAREREEEKHTDLAGDFENQIREAVNNNPRALEILTRILRDKLMLD